MQLLLLLVAVLLPITSSKDSTCSSLQHTCNSGECIQIALVCDGISQCQDGSDENECKKVEECNQFRCSNGQCIEESLRCDGQNDCGDRSDEVNCTCAETQFQCVSGQCINSSYKCDNKTDCDDNTDELGCTECTSEERQCDDGECKLKDWFCDGEVDCLDGSDELNCTCPKDNMFRCASGQCIDLSLQCDNATDCQDGSDERACSSHSTSCSTFQCKNNICISNQWVCDRFDDCGDNTDEIGCDYRPCPGNLYQCTDGRCLSDQLVCNNETDCSDGQDEVNCEPQAVNECLDKNGGCQHICTDLRLSFRCSCDSGYYLGPDSATCLDLNECLDSKTCAQLCTNNEGGFRCDCIEGFVSEGRNCRAVDGETFLVTKASEIIINGRTIVRSGKDIISAGYDLRKGVVVWLDAGYRSIFRAKIDGSEVAKIIHFPANMDVRCLTVDWINGNILWVDQTNATVYISLYSELIKSIHWGLGTHYQIKSIHIDPNIGYLFILVKVGSVHQILRGYIEGDLSVIKTFPTTELLMSLETISKRLFTLDPNTKVIEVMAYDGQMYRPIILKPDVRPTHLYVSNGNIYIAQSESSMLRVHFTTGNYTTIFKGVDKIRTVQIMSSALQSAPLGHPCSFVQCDQMCYVTCEKGCAHAKTVTDSPTMAAHCLCAESYHFRENSTTSCVLASCEFLCHSGRCVSKSQRCDGVDDCWDGSDERGCYKTACNIAQSACSGSGRCINNTLFCDGKDDCEIGEDEMNCEECSQEQFRCSTGKCIPLANKCDRTADCSDRSDEYSCNKCLTNDLQCASKDSCVPIEWACDGIKDCLDGSDEINCTVPVCGTGQMECDGGKCINLWYQCDGDNDCKDGTDEVGCPVGPCGEGMYECSNGDCIAQNQYCDGIAQCDDESDELKCIGKGYLCNTSEFTCSNGDCIPMKWSCDNSPDCTDATDELHCSEDTCSGIKCGDTCVPFERICDGTAQCEDKADELHCGKCGVGNGGCDQECKVDNATTYCGCKPGYILSEDRLHCNDINECLTLPCDQKCQNTPGGYLCTCYEGYTAQNSSCRANTPGILLYTSNTTLRSVHLRHPLVYPLESKDILKHDRKITSFDFFFQKDLIIFSDQHSIYKHSLDTRKTVHLIRNQNNVTQVTADWVNGNIYWVQSGTLHLTNIKMTGMKTLPLTGVSTVALSGNMIYWTSTTGKLNKCNLDGTDNIMLTMNKAKFVSIVTIDNLNSYLLWVDNQYNRVTLQTRSSITKALLSKSPDSLVLFEGMLYFNEQGSVYVAVGGVVEKVVEGEITGPLFVFHSTLQPLGNTPCNNQCTHLCITTATGSGRCLCSDGYKAMFGTCVLTDRGICDVKCTDGRCLAGGDRKCDGVPDCYDGSDESNCGTICSSDEFKCVSGGCVSEVFRCDTHHDCTDGSDELNCTTCTGYQCDNGRCISSRLKCNRGNDCLDNSDEKEELCGYHKCAAYLFECQPNLCIPLSWRCNGVKECSNGKDELGCQEKDCQYKCDTAGTHVKCLPATARCNAIPECEDGSDEKDCPPHVLCSNTEDTFLCKDKSLCLHKLFLCDGEAHCKDRSDEMNCTRRHCNEGDIVCGPPDNIECVAVRYKCDGIQHCQLGEDELDCPSCSSTDIQCDGLCLDKGVKCDGKTDCSNGADEFNCYTLVCSPDQFQCFSGSCVNRHSRCDGYKDCRDGSDEDNCGDTICPVTDFLCNNGNCISQELACDGADHCGDGSEELEDACKPKDECKDNRPCDTDLGTCVDLRIGYHCTCFRGYELSVDKKQCRDVNECLSGDICSQTCLNLVGSYVCSCLDGYILSNEDMATCVPQSGPDVILLILEESYMLQGTFYQQQKKLDLIDVGGDIRAVSYDQSYYYIAQNNTIFRYKRSSDVYHGQVVRTNTFASTLAVDWITGTVYWTDHVSGSIKAVGSGNVTVSLVDVNCEDPRGIVLLPNHGLMLWINKLNGYPVINSAWLDGSHRQILARRSVIAGLDVDQATGTVYYIEVTNSGISVIKMSLDGIHHDLVTTLQYHTIRSFSVYASVAYLVDAHTANIISCKLYGDKSVKVLLSGRGAHYVKTLHPLITRNGNTCQCEGTVCVNIPTDNTYKSTYSECVAPKTTFNDSKDNISEQAMRSSKTIIIVVVVMTVIVMLCCGMILLYKRINSYKRRVIQYKIQQNDVIARTNPVFEHYELEEDPEYTNAAVFEDSMHLIQPDETAI